MTTKKFYTQPATEVLTIGTTALMRLGDTSGHGSVNMAPMYRP